MVIINASQRHRVIIMKLAKNMLAAIGLMALLVIALNTVSAVAGVIGDAFDRQQSAHDAMIAEHKASLPNDDGNYVTDPMNGFDDEVVDTYEASEQAATARHANLFISNAYADN